MKKCKSCGIDSFVIIDGFCLNCFEIENLEKYRVETIESSKYFISENYKKISGLIYDKQERNEFISNVKYTLSTSPDYLEVIEVLKLEQLIKSKLIEISDLKDKLYGSL
jgi:hypothetical protein